MNRRNFLRTTSAGFGYLAFAGMASQAAAADARVDNPLAPEKPHFPAKAKRVIFLYMDGAPSHLDTFDYKPELSDHHGKVGKYGGTLYGSPFKFSQHGKSGLWVSSLFPNVARHADDLTLLRSMHCDPPFRIPTAIYPTAAVVATTIALAARRKHKHPPSNL